MGQGRARQDTDTDSAKFITPHNCTATTRFEVENQRAEEAQAAKGEEGGGGVAEGSACCCIANKSLRAEAKPCYKCANQNKNERQRRREREKAEKANLKVSESERAIELGWERVKSSCVAGTVRSG